MKQGVVKFSQEFVTRDGLKRWVGIEYPAVMDTQEQIHKALDEACDAVCSWPQVKNDRAESVVIKEIQVNDGVSDAKTMQDIMQSKTLPELETYSKFVAQFPQYRQTYNKRWKELGGKPSKKTVLP